MFIYTNRVARYPSPSLPPGWAVMIGRNLSDQFG
jgi:hypothetical protein